MHRASPSTASRFVTLLSALVLMGASACSDEDPTATEDTGRNPQGRDTGGRGDVSGADAGGDTLEADTEPGDDAGSDAEGDSGADTPNDCDRDGDGFEAAFCGGPDCDDDNPAVFPGAMERCDAIDNNCDGNINEGIDCTFFAHTNDDLYTVDPFQGVIDKVGPTPTTFLDFDTDTDGNLWGISSDHLYRLNGAERQWSKEHSLTAFSSTLNGFAISSTGVAYATGGNELFTLDLSTGSHERVGSFGGGFISSGDCVTDKADRLYMSTKRDGEHDQLVIVDGATGRAEAVGSIGFREVYGLTSAWGYLFGLTSRGELIEIDPTTGAGTLWHTFTNKRWYGAASTPAR